jgi:hypothetical protein
VPAHPLPLAQEPRTEHVVRPAARHRCEHPLELGRVVLAVAVQINGGRVALIPRKLEAAAKGRAEPARGLGGGHPRSPLAGHRGGAVLGAVVDHELVQRQATGLPGEP